MALAIVALLAAPALAPARADDKPGGFHCVRGEPTPAFAARRPSIKSASFELRSPTEAVEQVVFASGDALTIRNWGCEYYVLSFRYESKALPASGDARFWYGKAAETLEKLSRLKPQTVFSVGLAAKELRMKLGRRGSLELATEIPVSGDGVEFLQTRVVVKGGGGLAGGAGGYVEFDLLTGPL